MCCEDCNKKAKKYYNYCGYKICDGCIDRYIEEVEEDRRKEQEINDERI